MRSFTKLLGIAYLSMGLFASVHACTDFILKADDNSIISGRSLEFGILLNEKITAMPRGQVFESTAPNQMKGKNWTSKFGYVAISAFDGQAPFEGMNEQGLSIGALWLPTTQYQDIPAGRECCAVSVVDFGAWILGNFATVEEVKTAVSSVFVWGPLIPQMKMIPPLHFCVHDNQGNSIVIEFVNKQRIVYQNTVGVLTNYPTYDWHLNNLREYLNLSPYNPAETVVNGLSFKSLSQGGGWRGLPGDPLPSSRLLK